MGGAGTGRGAGVEEMDLSFHRELRDVGGRTTAVL